MRFVATIIFGVLISSGCSFNKILVEGAKKDLVIRALEENSRKINQLKASFEIKGSNILTSFFKERGNIVVQTPNKFLLTLLTPFSTPLFVAANDGYSFSSYNFSYSPPAFNHFLISKSSSFSLVGMRVFPAIFAQILLNRVLFFDAQDVRVFLSKETKTLLVNKDQGWKVEATLNLNNSLTRAVWSNHQEDVKYIVNYCQFESVKDVVFPRKMEIFMKDGVEKASFEIFLDDLSLNGLLEKDDVFQLQPF